MGDNNTEAPSTMDFKAKSKWNAWTSRKGLSQEAAKQSYVEEANALIKKYGVN